MHSVVVSDGWFPQSAWDFPDECEERKEYLFTHAPLRHPDLAVMCLPAGMEPQGKIAEAIDP